MPSIKEQLINVRVSRDLIDKFTPEEQRELYSKIIKYNNNKLDKAIEFSKKWQLDLLLGKFSAIQERSDLYSKDSRGYGIHFYIAWSGHMEALTWLYDNHPELCVKEVDTNIAHFAALSGNPELLTLIKSKNPELLTKTTIKNVSIAHFAGFSGTRATIDWIHENCPDVLTIKTVIGHTAGHTAAWAGNASAVKVLEAHCPQLYEEKTTLYQWTIEDFANDSGDSNTIITATLGSINIFNHKISRLQSEPSSIFASTNQLRLNKISALEALRDILFNEEGYNYNQLRVWYGIHGAAIEAQRNAFHAFFVPGHQSTTEKFVLGIFKTLNIEVNQVKSIFLDRDEDVSGCDSDHVSSLELTN